MLGAALIGGVVILLLLNPRLTGIMLAVVPPLMIVIVLWGKVLRRLSRQAQDEFAVRSHHRARSRGDVW